MKHLLRALGVGAALVLPITGCSIVGTVTAGATTTPTSFEATFTLQGPTAAVASACPQTTVALSPMTKATPTTPTKPTTWLDNQTPYAIICTNTGTVGHGVPATSTDTLLLTPTGFLLAATGSTVNLWKYTATDHTGIRFRVEFGTAKCLISFPANVIAAQSRTPTRYNATTISTTTMIITAQTTTTGICTSIATILHTPTSRVSVEITLL